MNLLLRKGVFPYDFMRNWRKVDFRMLPSRQQFYNKLRPSECSVADYTHARTVWREFGCQTMKDFSELYMKTGTFQKVFAFLIHIFHSLVFILC